MKIKFLPFIFFLIFKFISQRLGASLVAQTVKHLLVMQEIPDSEPGSGRSSGEGNGNPLQYASLENSTDRGA